MKKIVLCEVCKKVIDARYRSLRQDNSNTVCSGKCLEILNNNCYYDSKGELRISKFGLIKLNK